MELSLFALFTVLVMLLAGGLILYSLWFLIAATSIWFVKTWNATEVLRALLASGRYPLNAYPPALRLLFTLVLPVAFLTTVPAQVLLGEAAAPMLLAGLALAVCSLRRRGPSGSLPCASTPQHRVSAMLHAMVGDSA